jgi:hypothetical protein
MRDRTCDAVDEVLDGLWLITSRLKIGDKGEGIHNLQLYSFAPHGSTGGSLQRRCGEIRHEAVNVLLS